jgi:hypothetical protein
MDETTRELVAALCVRAGGLMEDQRAELVSRLADDPRIISRRITMLDQTARDLAAFAGVAHSFLRSAVVKK